MEGQLAYGDFSFGVCRLFRVAWGVKMGSVHEESFAQMHHRELLGLVNLDVIFAVIGLMQVLRHFEFSSRLPW